MKAIASSFAIYSSSSQTFGDSKQQIITSRANGIRPEALNGRFMNLDPTSISCSIAAQELGKIVPNNDIYATGMILISQEGSVVIRNEYINLFNQRRISPARFAASSYNSSTVVAAVTMPFKGSSIVISGPDANILTAKMVAKAKIKNKSLNIVVISKCLWSDITQVSFCGMVAYVDCDSNLNCHGNFKSRDTIVFLNETAINIPGSEDIIDLLIQNDIE